MDVHARRQDLSGLFVVGALLLLGKVEAEHRRSLGHQPLGGGLGEAGRLIPPLRIRDGMAFRPVRSQ